MSRSDQAKLTGRAPVSSQQGLYGTDGGATDHHPAGCDCRQCRRLRVAETRRRRKKLMRGVT